MSNIELKKRSLIMWPAIWVRVDERLARIRKTLASIKFWQLSCFVQRHSA